jgi:hypothetical protein
MADLTVLGANLHNSRHAVGHLRARSRADAPDHFTAAVVSEAHRRRRQLRGFPGHDYFTGPDRGPSQEVGILLDRRLPTLGHGYEHLSDAAPRFERVGKERWGHDLVTATRGTEVAIIGWHPVAGPLALHGDDPDHPLVLRYAEATRWLDATIGYHEARGREWVAVADCQMRESAAQLWSPRHVFANHGGTWLWDGIDVAAWSDGLNLVGNPRARVRHDVLPDHPLLRVDLNINRTRRRNRP